MKAMKSAWPPLRSAIWPKISNQSFQVGFDPAALDAVFEVLVRAGRNAPMAKTMLVPESWSKQAKDLPQLWRIWTPIATL